MPDAELNEYALDSLSEASDLQALLHLLLQGSDAVAAALEPIAASSRSVVLSRDGSPRPWLVGGGMARVVAEHDGWVEGSIGEAGEPYPCAALPLRARSGNVLGALILAVSPGCGITSMQRAGLEGAALLANALLEGRRAAHHESRCMAFNALLFDVLRRSAVGEPVCGLAERLCHGLSKQLHRARVSIERVGTDRRQLQRIGQSPAVPRVEPATFDLGHPHPPWTMALEQRVDILCSDLASDTRWSWLHEQLAAEGIAAMWVLPLFSRGEEAIGTLNVYFEKAGEPTASSRALVDMATSAAALIIEGDAVLRALHDSRRQLSETQEVARIGSFSVDALTGEKSGCDYTHRLLGIPEHVRSVDAAEYDRLIHPDDLDRVRHMRAEAARTGEPLDITYRIHRLNDGVQRWVHGRLVPIRDENGRIVRYTGALRDITDERQAEEALRLAQRASDASSAGILICDATQPDMPIIYTNVAYETLTGYRRDEVIGRNCRFLQGVDRDQGGLQEIRQAIREGREGHAVLRNYRKDGSPFWIDLRIAPVHDESGALTHYVGSQIDLTARIRYEEELAHRAGHDALTGLVNRNLLADRIEQAILHATASGAGFAVVILDLDRFKFVNDSMGHAAGDALLCAAAQRLRESVAPVDTVARMGGDEFVLLLTGTNGAEEAQRRADGSVQALCAPLDIDGQHLSLTASAGIALYPEHGTAASELLRHADIAMYAAKEGGRAHTRLFAPTLSAAAERRLQVKNEFQAAIASQQFVLHYQPKVDASDGTVVGFEALVRWQHPQRGLLQPAAFIDEAEALGVLDELGCWVIDEACRQSRLWCDSGSLALPIAVNVSASQFRNGRVVEEIEASLRRHGVDAQQLELEVTESVVMERPDEFVRTLSALRERGVRVSVDDFGTGYSSLSFLKRFPIDFLKIDRAFVRDVLNDASDAAICETIIVMAHNLGLRVIAEGVETIEQADFLWQRGCDYLQGYLFARPAPADTPFASRHEVHLNRS